LLIVASRIELSPPLPARSMCGMRWHEQPRVGRRQPPDQCAPGAGDVAWRTAGRPLTWTPDDDRETYLGRVAHRRE
jgi:hypothetical protein